MSVVHSSLESLVVADVGPNSITVQSAADWRTFSLDCSRLSDAHLAVVRLAFRVRASDSAYPKARRITLSAIVDRDGDGKCVEVHCVAVNLGAG